jgi:hypothetical protein
MQQVEEQVKQALARKDGIIQQMKAKQEEITQRNRNLEQLIEKQRMEFLS